MPVYGPPIATEPAGTRGRGVGRRGAWSAGSRPARYAKPGANPRNATAYSAAAWRRQSSSGDMPACARELREVRPRLAAVEDGDLVPARRPRRGEAPSVSDLAAQGLAGKPPRIEHEEERARAGHGVAQARQPIREQRLAERDGGAVGFVFRRVAVLDEDGAVGDIVDSGADLAHARVEPAPRRDASRESRPERRLRRSA